MTPIRMMCEIYVGCDGNWEAPEVQVSGSSKAMEAFGQILSELASSCLLEVPQQASPFYPVGLTRIELEFSEDDTTRLTMSVDESGLLLAGSSEAFRKLGKSLENFFDKDTQIGAHIHFDYYDGNPNFNETSCSLIFVCDQ